MGYQNVPLKNGYSLFTVTFDDIGGSDEYDIKNIVPCDANGVPLTTSKSKIKVQKMNLKTGGLTTQYQYTTASNKGWCLGSTALADKEVTLTQGEALCVTSTQGEGTTLRVSGAVSLTPVSTLIADGYTLIGNMTPVEIDLKDIVPVDKNGAPLTTSKGKIKIQKMNSKTGGLGTQYQYTTASSKGWCLGSTAIAYGDVTLKPGEAFCVTSSQGSEIALRLPSPVKE